MIDNAVLNAYAYNTLDEPARVQVEAALCASPQLRAQLGQIRRLQYKEGLAQGDRVWTTWARIKERLDKAPAQPSTPIPATARSLNVWQAVASRIASFFPDPTQGMANVIAIIALLITLLGLLSVIPGATGPTALPVCTTSSVTSDATPLPSSVTCVTPTRVEATSTLGKETSSPSQGSGRPTAALVPPQTSVAVGEQATPLPTATPVPSAGSGMPTHTPSVTPSVSGSVPPSASASVPTPTQSEKPTSSASSTPTATSTPGNNVTETPMLTPTSTPMPTNASTPPCEPTDQPLDIVLVVDRSPSMDSTKMADAKNAMRMLINKMDFSRDQVALVSFAHSGNLQQALTHDVNAVEVAVDALATSEGTNITEGIRLADRELSSKRHNPNAITIMIVLSDGQYNRGGDPQDAAVEAKADGVRIIAVGLGSDANEDALRTIASSSQDYYFAPDSSKLTAIYQAIDEATQPCVSPTHEG